MTGPEWEEAAENLLRRFDFQQLVGKILCLDGSRIYVFIIDMKSGDDKKDLAKRGHKAIENIPDIPHRDPTSSIRCTTGRISRRRRSLIG